MRLVKSFSDKAYICGRLRFNQDTLLPKSASFHIVKDAAPRSMRGRCHQLTWLGLSIHLIFAASAQAPRHYE